MKKNNKVLRLIVSIFIAVGLWVYVINVVNPTSQTVIRNIPVNLESVDVLEEKGFAIVGSGEYTVDITITAPRTDLNVVSADNFVATADVKDLTLGQDYITVEVTGPKGYTISEIRSRKIQVYVDNFVSKEVPVVVEASDAASGYEACIISVYPETIEIKGAAQLVDSVEEYSVSIDTEKELNYEQVSELSKTGVAKNKEGSTIVGVSSVTDSIDVKASVYSLKTVTLQLSYEGEPWVGAEIKNIDYPSTLVIKGPTTELSKVSELSTETISIEGIYESLEKSIDVKLPSQVYLAKENENPIFKVVVGENGSISFNYETSDIKTANLSDGLSVSYSLSEEESILAEITGPVNILKTMSAKDITLNADLQGLSSGTKDIKITVTTQISGINISIKPQTVKANIRKR